MQTSAAAAIVDNSFTGGNAAGYWSQSSADHVFILDALLGFYLADLPAVMLLRWDSSIVLHHVVTIATIALIRLADTGSAWIVLVCLVGRVCAVRALHTRAQVHMPADLVLNVYKLACDAQYTELARVLRIVNKWALLVSRPVFGLWFNAAFIKHSYLGDTPPPLAASAAFLAFVVLELIGTAWSVAAFIQDRSGRGRHAKQQ